jgi:hypothetical protein
MDINIDTIGLEPIHEEVYINSSLLPKREEVGYEIFFDHKKREFVCTKNNGEYHEAPETMVYSLDKEIDDLTEDERYEILNSMLSSVTKEDEVRLSDIFIHAKHTSLIYYIKDGITHFIPDTYSVKPLTVDLNNVIGKSPLDLSPENLVKLKEYIAGIKNLKGDGQNIDGQTMDYIIYELGFNDYVNSRFNYGEWNPQREN